MELPPTGLIDDDGDSDRSNVRKQMEFPWRLTSAYWIKRSVSRANKKKWSKNINQQDEGKMTLSPL